jgi:heme/copper-type cytochrome/quinol oxidase subunit 2
MKDILQVFKAVASAMVGVGKKENLAKDFEKTEKQGPWAYIIVALIMVAIFIGVIITAVRFALS